jgi:hypothetical protein
MRRFINIFHKNVDHIFSKCYNIFQEKINIFFSSSTFGLLPRPLPPPSPSVDGARQRRPAAQA